MIEYKKRNHSPKNSESEDEKSEDEKSEDEKKENKDGVFLNESEKKDQIIKKEEETLKKTRRL